MERSKCILICLLLFCFSIIGAQNEKRIIYESFVGNDMNRWKQLIDEMQKQKQDEKTLMELINFQYGYIAWCIGNKKKNEAGIYLDLAEANLKIAEEIGNNKSLISSYKSAFLGFRIGLSIIKAPILGPKSIDQAKEAIQLNKNNPYGYIQFANAKYYMPATFGGSKYIALENYVRAEKMFGTDAHPIQYNWNYINLLVIIAKAYTETNNLHLAKIYYEKVLKIEPEFLWIKDKLYPELLKKLQKKYE